MLVTYPNFDVLNPLLKSTAFKSANNFNRRRLLITQVSGKFESLLHKSFVEILFTVAGDDQFVCRRKKKGGKMRAAHGTCSTRKHGKHGSRHSSFPNLKKVS